MVELRKRRLRACFCCSEPDASFSTPSRRGFMLGAGALALTTAAGSGLASAQSADAKPFRIDVHHHLSPPTYVTASNEGGFGDALMKNWTIEKSLADMDKAGIATSMLSVTRPASISPRAMPPGGCVASRTNMAPSSSRIIPAGSAISRCCRLPISKAACSN